MDVANPDDIERIVRAVLKSINTPGAAAPAAKQCPPGVFDELDDAVAAAAGAHVHDWQGKPLDYTPRESFLNPGFRVSLY